MFKISDLMITVIPDRGLDDCWDAEFRPEGCVTDTCQVPTDCNCSPGCTGCTKTCCTCSDLYSRAAEPDEEGEEAEQKHRVEVLIELKSLLRKRLAETTPSAHIA